MKADELLTRVFEADSVFRSAEKELLAGPKEAVFEAILRAFEPALSEPGDDGAAKVAVLAELVLRVQQDGRAVDALIRTLGHENIAVRATAGRALLAVGYERYVELARGIDRAIEKGVSPIALEELPWIIGEIGEPSATKLLAQFLSHENANVVASAIEALVDLGDPGAIPLLEKLEKDERIVTLDEGDESFQSTLGELAGECIEELASQVDDD
jgi:HEAT repeat protein